MEIKKKIKKGYRLTNTIFEDTREAGLYQDGKLDMIARVPLAASPPVPQQLCDLLNTFSSHAEPAHEDFNKAVDEFKERVRAKTRAATKKNPLSDVYVKFFPLGCRLGDLPLGGPRGPAATAHPRGA